MNIIARAQKPTVIIVEPSPERFRQLEEILHEPVMQDRSWILVNSWPTATLIKQSYRHNSKPIEMIIGPEDWPFLLPRRLQLAKV